MPIAAVSPVGPKSWLALDVSTASGRTLRDPGDQRMRRNGSQTSNCHAGRNVQWIVHPDDHPSDAHQARQYKQSAANGPAIRREQERKRQGRVHGGVTARERRAKTGSHMLVTETELDRP